MMKRKKTTLLSLLLAVMMIVTFIPQAAFAEGDEGQEVQPPEKIEEPYMEVDFSSLADQNALALSEGMDETSVRSEPHAYGALIKGPVSELESGKVEIVSEFDFTGNPVGRISLHGVAEAGVLVDALVYLDDETEPLCEFRIDNRTKSGGWNIGAMQTANVYPKGITGTHKVSIGFRVSGKDGDQAVSILLRKIELSEDPGIPTLYFNDIGEDTSEEDAGTVEEMNTSEDHSIRCYGGSVEVKVPEGYKSEYEDSPMDDVTIPLDYIRGRGNSTWDADKKPYRFKLATKNVDLFGMGANAHWVLLANRYDNSLLRNRMTYWLGAHLGMEFTPQCVPVDVVMNGEYYGSYLLCEHVRIDDSRVEIDELKKSMTTLPDISGGYLLRMTPYDDEDPRSVFETKRDVSFMNEDPNFVDYENQQQADYIRGYIQDTEDAIFGSGFKNAAGESWQEYMDLDAAAGYWWVQEFSRNGDAYVTNSTYLYKKRNGKLFWGPLWDFDYVAWGDLGTPGEPEVKSFANTDMRWFDRLLADPDFTDKLLEIWNREGDGLNDLVTEIVKEGGILDQYYEQMIISERYDHEKYGYYGDRKPSEDDEYGGGEDEDRPDPDRPYLAEVDQLKEWVSARQNWVRDNIDDLDSVTSTITFVADGNVLDELVIKDMLMVEDVPDAPDKDGYLFTGWFTKPEGGEKLVLNGDVISTDECALLGEDITLYAQYGTEETVSKAEDLIIKDRIVWADLSQGEYTPSFVALPSDAIDNRITWTSSNEEMATVDKKGKVTLLKAGKVTVTGTLASGASASYVLNIYDPESVVFQEPEAIEVESEEVTLKMGSYGSDPYTLLPEGAPFASTWVYYQPEDEDIVVAGYCGELYPVSPGTTTVKVMDYGNDLETTFKVTVIGEEPDEDAPIDAIDNAIVTLVQMNALIKKADYTNASYAAYYAAYTKALNRLKEGTVTLDEVSELRHSVIMAQLDLVKKKTNTMKAKAKKTVNVKRSKVKRKAVTIKRSKAITVKNNKGKVTYAKVAKGSSKRLSISKTGKIKVKKKTKKGLYKIKVKIKAAGTGTYRPMTKVVTVKVRVK